MIEYSQQDFKKQFLIMGFSGYLKCWLEYPWLVFMFDIEICQ